MRASVVLLFLTLVSAAASGLSGSERLGAIDAPAASGVGDAGLAPMYGRRVVLADFEGGTLTLTSYDGEDQDPYDWEIQSDNTYNDTQYALRIWGNSWKELALSSYPVTEATVLQAALYVERPGELQAVGFGDASGNVLFYCVAGTQLLLSDRWNVVYQGAFPDSEWHAYRFAVGRDWKDTWGYLPNLTSIVFVNDRDQSPRGATVFDEIYDVTEDLPIAPAVEIQKAVGASLELPPDPRGAAAGTRYRVDVQFRSLVYDPDSPSHSYGWDFGDGTGSTDANPSHTFTAEADHSFTVALDVTDDTGLIGRDTTQVVVEPGGSAGLPSINFVGDVFMGRGYDDPGGLIDTHGVEYLWEPTREMLGPAADVTMINAECPYTDRGTPHPTKSVVFRTRPENVAGLLYAGVDIASTGNNHIVDYGLEGLTQTLAVFDSAGLVHAGAGINEYFAQQPCYFTQDGVRLGFVNQCNRTGRDYNEQPFLDAGYDKCGFGYWLEPNIDRALAQAESLADVVIAFPHSGIEYQVAAPPRGGSDASTVGLVDVEQCPPFVPFDQAADVRFRIWPGMADRQLRYHAVDLGADAVLSSHPHVLQGFEVYQGVLIAHSLGNFMFDLYYPETMPSIVLRATFDKEGIHSWTYRPVFIDQWIPKPATGRLGREILDRMADYSRALGTWVGVNRETLTGTIFLDPAQAEPVVTASQGTQSLQADDGSYLSLPILLAGNGSLSRIVELQGVSPSGAQVRFGREVLWFGGFEPEEGYHMWKLDSEDEWLDEEVYFAGAHSLVQHRQEGDAAEVTTLLDRHLPAADSLEYGLNGWARTENANGARFALRFYENRYTLTPMTTLNVIEEINGTTDWTWCAKDFATPAGARFFNVRCRLDKAEQGDAYAWFDDLRVVEWLPWQELTLPLDVRYPNNLRFVEIRVPQSADSVTVLYEETVLSDEGFTGVPDLPRAGAVEVHWAGASPNPFAAGTTFRYRLSATARVDLTVFDLAGRVVERLAQDAVQRPGWHRVTWEAQQAPAGIYFARLRVNGETHAAKLIRVR